MSSISKINLNYNINNCARIEIKTNTIYSCLKLKNDYRYKTVA